MLQVRKLKDIFSNLTNNLVIIQEYKNGFKCGNECILSPWVCGVEQDCADGSDEKECGK